MPAPVFISLSKEENSTLYELSVAKLSPQVFEDEYEVAMAVIAGIEARGGKGGYPVERFMFN